ncbi:MAG: AMP-binding protein [Clostridia bacterium]|nr:AMP-binding protein [Clostridia bacterium]
MKKNNEKSYREVVDFKTMMTENKTLYKDEVAFLVKGTEKYEEITYDTFCKHVDALGTALIDMGYKDQFIGVIGQNTYEWCVTYMAVLNGAGVIVPIDKELNVDEIDYIVNESKVKVLFYQGKYQKKIDELKKKNTLIEKFICTDEDKDIPFNEVIELGEELMKKGNTAYLDVVIEPDVLKVLLFTSGTTGTAKGVMLCHKNLAAQMYGIARIISLSKEDTSFSVLPIHHTFESTCGFLSMMYCGGTVGFCEGLRQFADNIVEVKPTIMSVVPLILEGLHTKIFKTANSKPVTKIAFKVLLFIAPVLSFKMRKKLFHSVHDSLGGKLKTFISGASAISEKVSRDFTKMGIKVLQGYGLTETSPISIGNQQYNYKHGALGLPFPGVEIKLDQVDERGIGEIMIKGDNVMLGYFNNEKATNEVMTDGWFHSGDLARVDKDGFYFMTGRKKNLIITKTGKNVFPEELESVLNENQFIFESMVTGSEEDITKETFIQAHIVPNIEKIKEVFGKLPSGEEIKKFIEDEIKIINKKLPSFKKIKKIIIREDEFEKTTTKKIKRHKNS